MTSGLLLPAYERGGLMITLDKFIEKRLKDDKKNLLDLDNKENNLQDCVNYIFEYFNTYINIDESRRLKIENDEKIVVRQTSDTLIATLDTEQFICLKNLHVITSLGSSDLCLKYVLSLINSKLLDFYHYLLNPEKGEALAEIKKENLEKLPIKNISKKEQQPFIDKVDQILSLKKDNPAADTSALEREIDFMVYALYGLSEEEIGIVENS